MTILLLKGYNNYFNRIRKQEVDITTYKTKSTSYLEYGEVNFNPNDGIVTELVVGGDLQKMASDKPLDFEESGSPDYLICYNTTTIKIDGVDTIVNEIHSRWFILECVRIMQGQYKLALKRDVLVDYGEDIMNSPCYVEKGWIDDVENPLLLNSEGMSFNQQKQGETILRDNTNAAWLVGYVKKDMNTAQQVTYSFPDEPAGLSDLDQFDWTNCVTFRDLDGTVTNPLKTAALYRDSDSTLKMRVWYPSAKTLGWVNPKNIRLTICVAGGSYNSTVDQLNQDWQGMTSCALDLEEHGLNNNHISIGIAESEAKTLAKEIYEHTFQWGYVNQYFNTLISATKYNITTGNNLVVTTEDLSKYNNRMFTYNNKVYKLTVGQGTEKSFDTYYTGEDNVCNDYLSSLYYEFMHGRFLYRNQDNPTKKKVKITLKYREFNITANEIPFGTMEFTLPVPSQRNQCVDAQYDIFCMPVSPNAFGLSSADTNLTILTANGDVSTGEGVIFIDNASEYQLAMAAALATKLGAGTSAGSIYDLQLLPYCPFDFGEDALYFNGQYYNVTYGKYVINLGNLNSKDYTIIHRNDLVEGQPVQTPVGIVFYPTKANFAQGIEYSEGNYTVHEEWLKIEKPVLLSQGRKDGLTLWSFLNFPYKVTDGTWDIGPNLNNNNVDIEISNGLTNADCTYLSLSVSGGTETPHLLITSSELPLEAANDYSTTLVADFDISVRAHWIKPDNALDKKIKNECDFYRLTSPNYNSFYEFKKTKLAGGINGLRAICTYKPYNPYIKINPNLNDSLYSIKDYNDNIGLMLAGDYSIPMLSDAMINYELQNRNYQAIFNRDLQSLDVSQRIAREQLDYQGLVGTIVGGFTGSAAGLSAGMKTGNPYVAAGMAIAGGVAGNVLPAIGWAKDKEWLSQQQYEERDYAIDKFNYSIGNIQALPQSMTKSTPLSFNNKVWPILEYFSCTDEEKTVLTNKIKYNGMTVMAIGQLKDYLTNGGFLQGKMIRLPDVKDDSHISNAIYEEVSKGFYEGE